MDTCIRLESAGHPRHRGRGPRRRARCAVAPELSAFAGKGPHVVELAVVRAGSCYQAGATRPAATVLAKGQVAGRSSRAGVIRGVIRSLLVGWEAANRLARRLRGAVSLQSDN